MRKVDESRAANYIRKHSNYKKWLAFVLCLSLLTGTVTLYILNKPATAMTAEGAEGLGVVLETASSADEEELIQQTLENKSVSNDNGDDDLFTEFSNDDDENAGGNGDDDDLNKSGDDEESKEDLVGKETVEGEAKEGETKEGEEQEEEAEKEDELTQDVVLTVSYVDEDGEAIAEEKEIDIYDSIDLTSEAPSIEGYTFKEATFKGDVITKVAVKKNADDIRYYEVTFDDDETKEIKKDAAVVLTYIKDEEEVEVDASVTLTAKYVDKDGEDIQDSEEISFAKETSINKDNAPEIDGYFFMKAVYDGQEIVKITPVEAEAEVEAEDSDNEEETTEETEKANTVSVEGYEFTTADGETVEITEDAEIEYTYVKASEETEFTYSDGKVTVTATINGKNVFPEGIVLKVAEITSESTGYNYDAYLQAMNDKASEIAEKSGSEEAATYDEKNTLMYDIAFMLDEVEYQPAEGSVQISIKLNDKKLSEENNVASEDDVTVIHLPIVEEVLENLNATSDATDIIASDVKVEVLTESEIAFSEDADSITFETSSFSVHAITWNSSKYTWTGDTEYSTSDIIGRLGKSQYFGAVASVYVGTSSHSESSVAAKDFLIGSNQCLGNSLNVYQKIEGCTATLTKKVNTIEKNPRYYWFAVYSDAEGKNRLGNSFYLTVNKNKDSARATIEFSFSQSSNGIRVKAKRSGSELFSQNIEGKDLANLFIFELDGKNGNPIKNGEVKQLSYIGSKPTYEVTYTSDEIEGGNSIINGLAESYAYNVYQGGGGSIEDEVAKLENGSTPLATEKQIYGVLTPLAGNKFYFKNPQLLNGYDYYSENYYGSDGNNHDPNLSLAGHNGDFPVNIDSLLNNAADLSVDLAAAKDAKSGKTEVYNIKATTGSIYSDALNAFGRARNIDISDSSKSLKVSDGHIAIINLDLSNYKDSGSGYQIDHFFVNKKQTGDWSDIAEKLIINAVQWNEQSQQFEPYTGKLTIDTCSGTVIAPKAKVQVTGSFSGTVIADKLRQACEIHKWELRLNKKITANIEVSNVDISKKEYEIELTKLWETNKGTNSIDETKVEFTLYKKNKNSNSYTVVTGVKPTLVKNDLNNTWVYKWTGLEEPKDFDYYVAETKVPNEFTSSNPETKKLKVVFPEDATTGTVTGTAEIKNKSIPHGIIEKVWDGADAPYDYLFVFVSASTYGGLTGSDEKPEYSSVVELRKKDGWKAEVPFLADYDGDEKPSNMLVYHVSEINAFRNGRDLSAGLPFNKSELERILLGGKTINGRSKDDVLMDAGDKVSGFKVSYSSDVSEDSSLGNVSDWESVVYVPGQEGKTVKITNTYDLTKVVVKKQWGFDGDPYAKNQSFDVEIQLLRKLKTDGEDKYVAVDGKTATLHSGEESVEFTDLPQTDDSGVGYDYSVQESVGDKVFDLDGDSINGFKLKSIEPFVVEDGIGIKITNVPVMLIEKIFSVNGKELSKQEASERFPEKQIFVHLYKSFDENNPTLITLNKENNWQQEVEITRGITSANNDQQQCYYYIVEYNATAKTDYPESGTIMYFRYIGEDDVASSTVGSQLQIKGNEINSAKLKLQVRNELGDNVLPSAGGIGDIPYMAAGAGTAIVGLLGAGVYSRKKKKDDEE